jgi:ribose transport system ATP-binding protein
VIFISHRLLEISALCDRATVLRDGQTVGVVDMGAGAQDRIVELMLGSPAEKVRHAARGHSGAASKPAESAPRLRVRNLQVGTKLEDVSFDLLAGEVLGVVALEGQGQDELFGVLSGSERPSGGAMEVEGRDVQFRHPSDAIRAGLVFVPGDRTEALLMQRSVRENIALPFSARPSAWGPIDRAMEKTQVGGAIQRLQIDTRAQSEVQRLSGGNQQKVTIARWIATGAPHTALFRPDARHRHPHEARF